ncbi:MAG: YncE family protein [Bacteroidia bacterium]|nr:YncE family protein [Bacteroidia bacterium]
MYAVINASNIIEVMDAATAKHIAQIEIPNCRKITFYQGKAYVSSYAGVLLEDNTQLGYVAEIDTSSFIVNRTISVGYQPEGMAAVDGKLYVANSGGYLYPVYDNKLSIIDIETFTEVSCVEVAVNMQTVQADSRGNILIVSWGNYYDVQSDLILFDTKSTSIKKRFNIRAGSVCLVGDSAYVGNFDYLTNQSTYTLVNIATEEVVPGSFIASGYEDIVLRSVAVNPENHDIFLMDAADYVSPGSIYCFSSEGEFKWKKTAGNTPGYIAFKKKTQL